MARSELRVQVLRNGRTQDQFRAFADEDDIEELRELLTTWLASHHWDEALWPQFTLTTPGSVRLIEVRA